MTQVDATLAGLSVALRYLTIGLAVYVALSVLVGLWLGFGLRRVADEHTKALGPTVLHTASGRVMRVVCYRRRYRTDGAVVRDDDGLTRWVPLSCLIHPDTINDPGPARPNPLFKES